MTTTFATNTDGTVDFDKFRTNYRALLDDMKTYLIERDDEIWGMGLAALGKLNIFNLGEPGLAKSMLPREFVSRIDGLGDNGFFDLQIRRTTLPEEILGPVSLKGLDEDRFVRSPRNRLPEARVFLADEFFKAPSAVLNVVLRAFEEREWDNDGQVHPIPLWFAICPSNECPTDSEFEAIRDRLALSYVSSPIQSNDNFVKMMKAASDQVRPEPEKFVTADEVEAAQGEIHKVDVPDNIFEILVDLRRTLTHDEGVKLSDRRYTKGLSVLQTNAWLNGRDEVDNEDIRILEHVLWMDPEDKRKVRSAVMQMVSPIERQAVDIMEKLVDLSETYARDVRDTEVHEERVHKILQAQKGWREITNEIKDVDEEAKRKGYKSTALSDVKKQAQEFNTRLMDDLGVGSDTNDWGDES